MWRNPAMNYSESENKSDMTVVQVQEGVGGDDVTTPTSSFEPGDQKFPIGPLTAI